MLKQLANFPFFHAVISANDSFLMKLRLDDGFSPPPLHMTRATKNAHGKFDDLDDDKQLQRIFPRHWQANYLINDCSRVYWVHGKLNFDFSKFSCAWNFFFQNLKIWWLNICSKRGISFFYVQQRGCLFLASKGLTVLKKCNYNSINMKWDENCSNFHKKKRGKFRPKCNLKIRWLVGVLHFGCSR